MLLYTSKIKYSKLQWNMSNPTHQGTTDMCQIVQDDGIVRSYFS